MIVFIENQMEYPLPSPGFMQIRKHAKAYGMSRLAKDMGISRAHLYRILSATGNPTIKHLFALIKLLNFTSKVVTLPAPPSAS